MSLLDIDIRQDTIKIPDYYYIGSYDLGRFADKVAGGYHRSVLIYYTPKNSTSGKSQRHSILCSSKRHICNSIREVLIRFSKKYDNVYIWLDEGIDVALTLDEMNKFYPKYLKLRAKAARRHKRKH